MKVFEWCYTLDNTLHEARRPTEAEKTRYSADRAENMIFVANGVAKIADIEIALYDINISRRNIFISLLYWENI